MRFVWAIFEYLSFWAMGKLPKVKLANKACQFGLLGNGLNGQLCPAQIAQTNLSIFANRSSFLILCFSRLNNAHRFYDIDSKNYLLIILLNIYIISLYSPIIPRFLFIYPQFSLDFFQ